MADARRALVVGGGIAGLTAALDLADGTFDAVELWEADHRVGGKIRTSAFAGLSGVDEAADAYLLRVPYASDLATRVGVDRVVHPTGAAPSVWHGRLHDLPGGLVLGLPADVRPFARSGLISWRGKLRAAIEPLLPRVDPGDSLGALVRARFGQEVHERLVDALVGSIYAADTDRWSLTAVPQLAAVAERHRSVLLGARAAKRHAPPTGGPVFGAPAAGMAALTDATAAAAVEQGVVIRTERRAAGMSAHHDGWLVDGERFDAVVLATPAAEAAMLTADVAADSSAAIATITTSDVIMVRVAVDAWPPQLSGRSGYLVPKPDQHLVTAVSFASEKWAHWRPDEQTQVLRVSLGRDGMPVDHLDDDQVIGAVVDDVGRHLAIDLQPREVAISRWPGAFAQYRPYHHQLVAHARRALPAGLALAGAPYDGIGIPACIASGSGAAATVKQSLTTAD